MVLTKLKKSVGKIALVGLFSSAISADPFEECPSKAYLFQSNNVQIYGLNLVTGSYSLLEDYVGIDGNINGVGFNFIDRYIYGFNTSSLSVVRISKDFQATELNVSGLPADKTFFVGDVADNYYYIYRKNVGFYRINLDQQRENYLVAERIDTANTSLQLTDFAVHPGNDKLYAVDNNTGILHQISVTTGESIEVGDTGETGTFGAGYFDVNGYYYISRNSDGNIFRIDLTNPEQPNVNAVLFAQGPFSNQNDGARCAYAPISVENTDWGDAPASYGTLFSDNGPRHEITSTLYLGSIAPDGESDGLPFAVNDDNSNQDDEDGIGFVTPIEIGLDGLIQVTVEGGGYLHGWIDWNADGDFSDDLENVFSAVELSSGTHTLSYRTPEAAVEGNSWARFRYSSAQDLTVLGGAPDGEVEDYSVSISQPDISYRYYPSETGWVALAYEDIWPSIGDYDLNDVVMHYRVVELVRDEQVIRVDLYGSLQALGAVYHNGFAVHLQTVARSNVDQSRLRTLFNNELQAFNPLEEGQSEAVLKITDDLRLNVETDCRFYRTEADCTEAVEFSFEVSVNFINPIGLEAMPAAPYNPFIFGTPYWGRDEVFVESPGRSLEIHLPDLPNTDLADESLFGLNDDTSDITSQRYYKTSGNLPWAIEVGVEWSYPLERVDVLDAYPQFKDWVESGGTTNESWYLPENAIVQKVY
jgi:LruC domain-containing protein